MQVCLMCILYTYKELYKEGEYFFEMQTEIVHLPKDRFTDDQVISNQFSTNTQFTEVSWNLNYKVC